MELQRIISALESDEEVNNAKPARLLPHNNLKQKEERLTSIVLAAIEVVPQFAELLMSSINQSIGSRSKLDCFIELELLRDSRTNRSAERPDGLIVHRNGKKSWICLIEAKSGNDSLNENQLKRYLEFALTNNRKSSFPTIDALLTITNDFVAIPDHHPMSNLVHHKSNFKLLHWSWTYILTQAEILLAQEDFKDSTQKRIVRELISYMECKDSGVRQFTKMNRDWKEFTRLARLKQLSDKGNDGRSLLEDSVGAWHQECRDIVLLLSREVKSTVTLKLPRNHTKSAKTRIENDIQRVLKEGLLSCCIDVPNAASPIYIDIDVTTRQLEISMIFKAPSDRKRPESRIKWLLKQLKLDKSWPLELQCFGPRRKCLDKYLNCYKISQDYSDIRNKIDFTPEQFKIVWVVDMTSDFSGTEKFVQCLESNIKIFYKNIVEHVKPFQARAPIMQDID